jgi:hypothetical protein
LDAVGNRGVGRRQLEREKMTGGGEECDKAHPMDKTGGAAFNVVSLLLSPSLSQPPPPPLSSLKLPL